MWAHPPWVVELRHPMIHADVAALVDGLEPLPTPLPTPLPVAPASVVTGQDLLF